MGQKATKAGALSRVRHAQALLGDIRNMLQFDDCQMLKYLIDMAYFESYDYLRAEHQKTVAEKNRVA